MTLLLKNGTVVDPSQNLDQVKLDVLIKDGKIADLAQIESQTNWEVVNLAGCFVAPGFVDMHVHLREPGQEEKETIKRLTSQKGLSLKNISKRDRRLRSELTFQHLRHGIMLSGETSLKQPMVSRLLGRET